MFENLASLCTKISKSWFVLLLFAALTFYKGYTVGERSEKTVPVIHVPVIRVL